MATSRGRTGSLGGMLGSADWRRSEDPLCSSQISHENKPGSVPLKGKNFNFSKIIQGMMKRAGTPAAIGSGSPELLHSLLQGQS